jgi:hypothetical protein
MERHPNSGGRTRAQAGLPPLDRDELQRDIDRSSIKVLGELSDHDDAIGKPFAVSTGFDLNCCTAACPLLPTSVVRRMTSVEDATYPCEVARQFDVSINHLGVQLCVEHHSGPSPKQPV